MKKIKKAIKKTAKNNQVTVNELKKEIFNAIEAAIENPNKNLYAEAFWKNLTKNKKRPTPNEVIAAIYEKIFKV